MTFNLGEVYVVAVAHRCTFSVPVNVKRVYSWITKSSSYTSYQLKTLNVI